MRVKYKLLVTLIFSLFLFPSLTHRVLAAQTPSGITVSPAFQQVSVPAGTAQQPVTFTITNNKKSPQSISLSVADFNTLNESGGLFFVGTNPTQLQQKYGLAKWVSLPQKQLTLSASQTVKINAEILNLPTLAAGGHYGALMISLTGSGSGANEVGLKPIASSLLFATKQPGDTHHLSLSNVYIKHSIFSLPKTVTLRFYNDGNTHVVPRGVVQIVGPNGKLISRGIINQNSGIILPETYRQYKVELSSQTTARLPGSYKLSVDFRFDGIDQFRGYQTSFYYVSLAASVIAAVVILTMLMLGYKLYKSVKLKRRTRTS
jgi:hypothetical protein